MRAAQEGLAPIVLPDNWSSLTPAEKLFVFTDLERTSRGEAAVPDLVKTYDQAVAYGASHNQDPMLSGVSFGSIWAGGSSPYLVVNAMYDWMYSDGPGSGNLDCTKAGQPGCWGHRDNILRHQPGPAVMDAVAEVTAQTTSYAAAFVYGVSPKPSDVVLTWAAEQPHLAKASGSGGTGPQAKVTRLAGSTRVGTAIAVSKVAFPAAHSARAVVLARDDRFPDALTGGPLARAEDGPLLLTGSSGLDPATLAEIKRVVPAGAPVYLLGGNDALSPAVASGLSAAGFTPVRLAGPNRFATAVVVAGAFNPTTVFEASGLGFPDALAAGPAAAASHGAILLTNGSHQSQATSGYLLANPSLGRVAVGGPAAAADPGATPLAGANRFDTAAAVASRFFPKPALAGLATGLAFPDALAAGPYLGARGAPLLLVNPTGALPSAVKGYLSAHHSTITGLDVLGGTQAV
ncbi:MAG: cell wall-binding repeat-containing protein, partial [Acidimicrobiales bacterium]